MHGECALCNGAVVVTWLIIDFISHSINMCVVLHSTLYDCMYTFLSRHRSAKTQCYVGTAFRLTSVKIMS